MKEVELVWHYLVHNKTLRSRRTPEDLDALRASTIRLIDTIEAESEFAPKPGPLCRWCDYAELCEAAPAEVRTAAQERGGLVLPPPAALALDDDGGRQLSLLGD